MGTGDQTGGGTPLPPAGVDFFVSYAPVDQGWGEWLAWQLEAAGYTTRLQAWDFTAGSHFVTEMHHAARHAARTVAVLSAAYLSSAFEQAQWQAAWAQDPGGLQRRLLLVRVEDCPAPGLLGQLVSVDLVGLDPAQAADRLLAAAAGQRGKPPVAPLFPGLFTSRDLSPQTETEVAPGFPRDTGRVGAGGFTGPGGAQWGDHNVQHNHFHGESRPVVDGPVRVGVVPKVAGCFQPRAAASQLEAAVDGGGAAVLCQVLAGMGGVGKTQLAAHHAEQVWAAGAVEAGVGDRGEPGSDPHRLRPRRRPPVRRRPGRPADRRRAAVGLAGRYPPALADRAG